MIESRRHCVFQSRWLYGEFRSTFLYKNIYHA